MEPSGHTFTLSYKVLSWVVLTEFFDDVVVQSQPLQLWPPNQPGQSHVTTIIQVALID